jgi:drug/metabolite transporter (DMT)-like permease
LLISTETSRNSVEFKSQRYRCFIFIHDFDKTDTSAVKIKNFRKYAWVLEFMRGFRDRVSKFEGFMSYTTVFFLFIIKKEFIGLRCLKMPDFSWHKKYEGALWKMASGICFAVLNGVAKSSTLPAMQTVCLQNLLGAFFIVVLLRKVPKDVFFRKTYFIRAFVALPGVILWLKAIRALPLGQAVALGFLGPFFTTLGAKLFLKENVGIRKSIAIFLGTIGGLVILYGPCLGHPMDLSLMDHRLLWPLLATLAFSLCSLTGKYLALKERPEHMAFSLMACLGVMLLPTLPFWAALSWSSFGTVALLGLLAMMAHFSLSKAFCCADLTFLLPFGSVRFIASSLIGWYIYHQAPTYWVFMGMGIILGGLWVLASSQKHS